jgi:hypothetical protein
MLEHLQNLNTAHPKKPKLYITYMSIYHHQNEEENNNIDTVIKPSELGQSSNTWEQQYKFKI